MPLSVLERDLAKSQILLFLSTATPYWGIHVFAINFLRKLWSVRSKIYEEEEEFALLPLASFVADSVLHAYWDSIYLLNHENVHVHLDGYISIRSEVYTRSTGLANMKEAHLPVSYTFPEEHLQN